MEDYVREFFEFCHGVNFKETDLKDMFGRGLNKFLYFLMPHDTPHYTLAQYIGFALLLSGSPFTVGFASEEPHKLTLFPKPVIVHVMPTTPEPPAEEAVPEPAAEEAVPELAVPEPAVEEAVPEPAVEEAVPEPAVEEAVPELAVPEPAAEEAVPEPAAEEAVPELAVPEPAAEEAVPEPAAEEAVPEPAAEEAVPEPAVEEAVQLSLNSLSLNSLSLNPLWRKLSLNSLSLTPLRRKLSRNPLRRRLLLSTPRWALPSWSRIKPGLPRRTNSSLFLSMLWRALPRLFLNCLVRPGRIYGMLCPGRPYSLLH
ncbi:hypothetical protein PO909_026794 [Leuciscus waleckii]